MQNKKVNMKTFIKNYMKAVGVVCACMAAFPACTDMMETDSTTVGFEEDNRLDSPNDSLYSVLGILSRCNVWATVMCCWESCVAT